MDEKIINNQFICDIFVYIESLAATAFNIGNDKDKKIVLKKIFDISSYILKQYELHGYELKYPYELVKMWNKEEEQ